MPPKATSGLPESQEPNRSNEDKFIRTRMKTHFDGKGFALGHALKMSVWGTRKLPTWPEKSPTFLPATTWQRQENFTFQTKAWVR